MPLALRANALTDLATARDHLSIPGSDTSRDDRITRFVNTASAMIERYTRRKLLTQSYTEIQDGNRQDRLLVKQWPITGGPAAGATKPSIYVSTDPTFPAASALDPATYVVDNEGIMVVLIDGSQFPRGNQNVKLMFDAGLGAIGTLPSDLEHACLELTLWYYLGNSNSEVGKISKSKGGETIQLEQLVPQHVALLLEPYVRHEFHVGQAPVGNG